MGNDGGSIPTRRELVKEAARNPTTTQIKEVLQEQQEYHWTTCPLSHKPLTQPIVSDSAGNLYNKDAILEFLLPPGETTPESIKYDSETILDGRVKSLRDVVEVKFETKEADEPSRTSKWVCPITNKTLGPGIKAVYLVPCGHAFLENAVREISGENCLQCNEPYTPDNVIAILPTSAEERTRQEARVQKLKGQSLAHSLKKAPGLAKKRKKNGRIGTEENAKEGKDFSVPKTPTKVLASQHGNGTPTPFSGIKNAATASLTAKVLAEEQERNKRRKTGANENLKSLFSSDKVVEKDGGFMTRGYSIPASARHS